MGGTLTPKMYTFMQFLALLLTLRGCRRAILGLCTSGVRDYVTENILSASSWKTEQKLEMVNYLKHGKRPEVYISRAQVHKGCE